MTQKLITIQYLRAIAALMIICFHTFYLTCGSCAFPTFDIFKYFFHGVTVFFFISGLIMSHIIRFETDAQTFIKKRIARIYPTYFQAYLIAIIIWIIFRALFHIHVSQHGSWGLHLSLLPFEFDGTNGKMVVPAAWTLYYEMFFYIIIAISLAIFKKPKYGIYLFLFVLIFFPKSFLFNGFYSNIFLEFVAGFLYMEILKDTKKIDIFLLFGTMFMLALTDSVMATSLAIIMAIVGIGFELERRNKLFKSKLLMSIGDASYSLYLIHIPLLGAINTFYKMVDNNFIKWMILAVGLISIIKLSIWNYENFEKKVAIRLKKYL